MRSLEDIQRIIKHLRADGTLERIEQAGVLHQKLRVKRSNGEWQECWVYHCEFLWAIVQVTWTEDGEDDFRYKNVAVEDLVTWNPLLGAQRPSTQPTHVDCATTTELGEWFKKVYSP